MKRIASLVAACLVATPLLAQSPLSVNGQDIPANQIDEFVTALVGQGATDSPELREQVREELINRAVIAQAAEKAGIPEQPKVRAELDLARQSVLIRGLFNDYLERHPITDAQVQAEYEQIKAANQRNEYLARHILVKDEQEARAILAQLQKGGDFEKIAREKSQDPGSGAQGGSLGWSAADTYVAPFAEALSALKKGETTTAPVQSDFGWHIIRLDDVRQAEFPPLEQVRPQVEDMLRQQSLAAYQKELRDSAVVKP